MTCKHCIIYILTLMFLTNAAHAQTLEEEFAAADAFEATARKDHTWLTNDEQHYLFNEFKSLADRGHPCAHERISWDFVTGNVTDQDFSKAFSYASKAMELGCTDALHTLGYLYESEKGVPEDLRKAFHFYLMSADKGYVKSAYKVYEIYRMGNEAIGIDLLEAYKWLVVAADNGHTEAKKQLASCDYNGYFCESHLDIKY